MSLVDRLHLSMKWLLPKLSLLNSADQYYACHLLKAERTLPPVFIVGAPRTGTTILYQSLLSRFSFNYTSNLEALLFTLPVLTHRVMMHIKANRRDMGVSSEYGYIKGISSPSEAGALMRYFLDGNRPAELATCLAAITTLTGRPYLNKNTFNSLRLKKIVNGLPDSFIIWMSRDIENTKASILRMRRDLTGSEDNWLGVGRPETSEILDLPAEQQVEFQIKSVNQAISEGLETTGLTYCTVSYEEFCEDTEAVLGRVMAKYQSHLDGLGLTGD